MLVVALAVAGYHGVASRGAVTEGDRALAGADVVLFDDARVVAATRTGADGTYRLWHAFGARAGRALAVCAPGHHPFVRRPALSALVTTKWGWGAVRESAAQLRFAWPDELRDRADVPAACRRPSA